MLVSIIIPLYNRSDLTKNCLNSIFNNGSTIDFEVIVVNNASEDNTLEVLEEFNDRITLIDNQENVGFSKGNNMGAAIAKGDLLIMLNNDTEVRSGWIEALVTCQQETQAELVGARLYYPNGAIQHCGVALYPQDQKPHALYAGLVPTHSDFQRLTGIRRPFQIVTAACWLITKKAWDALGGFDEGFINGYEDVDLCLRLGQLGGLIMYEPTCEITHFESQSPGRGQHTAHNEELLFSRWRDKWVCDLDHYLTEDGLYFDAPNGTYGPHPHQPLLGRNLQTLLAQDKGLTERILNHREGWNRRRCDVLDGKSLKMVTRDGMTITLHSKRAPEDEAKRLVEAHLATMSEGYLSVSVLGFGFAWHLEEFLKQIGPETKLLVQIVDPLVFRMALENRDLQTLLNDPRLYFVNELEKNTFILPAYKQLLS